MPRNRNSSPGDPGCSSFEARGRVRFGSFEADLSERSLYRAGRLVAIQEQPFRLLALLLARPGELVTREEMRRAIWPDGTTVDFDRGLNTAVNKLRVALGDGAESPRFIETVPRRGCRFLANIDVDVGETSRDRTDGSPIAMGRDRKNRVMAVVVAAVIVLVLLTYGVSQQRNVPNTEFVEVKSRLAVLPFVNLSSAGGEDFISKGLTEEMTSRLGRLAPGQLAVIARTTMMTYSDTSKPISEIAVELGVDYVLEGSVRRSTDRTRITAQLIRTSDQTQLWSEDYDSRVDDILSVQVAVAQRIAQSLAVDILPNAHDATSVNPAAYDAYLRGLHFRDMLTEDGYRKAIESFEQALELDPNFAPAYAAMSACYCLLAGHGLEVSDPSTLMPRTREFAMRALELDPTLSDAQGALGMALFKHEWDWPSAEWALRRATEMNPSDSMARIWYAFFLAAQGRHDAALVQVDEARNADPFSRVVNVNWAWQQYEARRYEKAVGRFDETLELFPDFWIALWGRGLSHLGLGARTESLNDLRRAVVLSEGNISALGALGFAYAKLGESDEARRILERLSERSQRQYVPSVIFVGLHGALGEIDLAFDSLERAYEQRSRSLAWIRVGHEFDPLRVDSRFQAMLQRMDLAL